MATTDMGLLEALLLVALCAKFFGVAAMVSYSYIFILGCYIGGYVGLFVVACLLSVIAVLLRRSS